MAPLAPSPIAEDVNINERVHWSVLAKRGRACVYDGKPDTPYAPPNLPADIPADKIAEQTPEERALWPDAVSPPPSPPEASFPIQTPA